MKKLPSLEIVILLSVRVVISGAIISLLNLLLYWFLVDISLIPEMLDVKGYLITLSYLSATMVVYLSCKYTMNLPAQRILIEYEDDYDYEIKVTKEDLQSKTMNKD